MRSQQLDTFHAKVTRLLAVPKDQWAQEAIDGEGKRWFTPPDVAHYINEVIELRDAYKPGFIREEILVGILVARVFDRRAQKRLIRIHPEDFDAWARKKVSAERYDRVDAVIAIATAPATPVGG